MKFKKLIVPVIAFSCAVAGAFATNIAKSNIVDSTLEMGYIDAPNPCTIQVECTTTQGEICRNQNGQQAFGKNSPTLCSKVLYRVSP